MFIIWSGLIGHENTNMGLSNNRIERDQFVLELSMVFGVPNAPKHMAIAKRRVSTTWPLQLPKFNYQNKYGEHI